ncbi:hypothetical protein FGO68_gene7569 [Halteria grandinella]|uniref:CHAT domain-containing protein n=1 Tax=Halteria grandinella TaxID=5974 RepID=A0A8J8NHY3_HALGN|nr:hypothetical protein FGO68_gene7569 [Halteria grandinella]
MMKKITFQSLMNIKKVNCSFHLINMAMPFMSHQADQNISLKNIILRKEINLMEDQYYVNFKRNLVFYNYEKQQFVDMDELYSLQTNLLHLNEEYVPQDCPLIIKVKVQLFYHEFRKIKQFLENIQQQKQIFEETIQQEKNELSKQTEILNQFQSELQQLKQLYPIKVTYPQVDVAFLYSHPIIKPKEPDPERVQPVSYFREIQEIRFKTQEEQKKLTCLILCATEENLREALKYNPKIIHIMSHGDKSNEKGYFLQFENECLEYQLTTDQIQRIFGARKDLQLVILSSCHSGEIAQRLKTFAPTIAVQAQYKMYDEASIWYSAALYQQLLKKKSLEESHNIAKKETVEILRDRSLSCCCSHTHNKTCQYKYCLTHDYNCQCENRKHLKHKWEPNNKCSIEKFVYDYFSGEQLDKLKRKLDYQSKKGNGELKICCCEISNLLLNDNEEFEQVEHNESEKFQIFSQMPTTEEIFNEAQEGEFTVMNQLALEEAYDFVGWFKDVVTVYKQLGGEINANKRKIILLYVDGEYRPKMQSVMKDFALKASKYFIVKYIINLGT